MSKTNFDFINSISFDDDIDLSDLIKDKNNSKMLDYENLINSIYSVCTFNNKGFISYKNNNFKDNLNAFVKDESIYTFLKKEKIIEIFDYLNFESKWYGQIQIKDDNKDLYILNCQVVKIEESQLDEYIFLSSELSKC